MKFERILETYLAFAPKGISSFLKAIPLWIKKKLWIKTLIQEEIGFAGKILFPEHHASHAASAFYASPFQDAAFLTMDGVGEWATTSYGIGDGNKMEVLADIKFPNSLGLLYSAFTYYTGFRVNSGEYKVMGLAPYGKPKYKDLIYKHLIDVKDDGSFKMDKDYGEVDQAEPFYSSEGYLIGNSNPANHYPEKGLWTYRGHFVTIETNYVDWMKNGFHREWTSGNSKLLVEGSYKDGKNMVIGPDTIRVQLIMIIQLVLNYTSKNMSMMRKMGNMFIIIQMVAKRKKDI